jgi:hypothetical protein
VDIDRHRSILQSKILAGVDDTQLVIGSWEGLGNSRVNLHAARIRRLQSVFGCLRVMITIRNPLTQVPSQYLQDMAGHFVKRRISWMGNSSYVDIEKWLEHKYAKRRSPEEVLSYSLNIQTACNLLGRKNVGIFVFKQLVADPEQYYHGICEFIGLDGLHGLALTREKHLHRRITQGQVEYLQELNRSTGNRLFLRARSRKSRERLFDAKAVDGVPATATVPPQWEKQICDATRVGHRWIAENYSIPLEQYEYPL